MTRVLSRIHVSYHLQSYGAVGSVPFINAKVNYSLRLSFSNEECKSNSTDIEHVKTAIFYRKIKHGSFHSLYMIGENHWIVFEYRFNGQGSFFQFLKYDSVFKSHSTAHTSHPRLCDTQISSPSV